MKVVKKKIHVLPVYNAKINTTSLSCPKTFQFFSCHLKMKLYFFGHLILFLLLCGNKRHQKQKRFVAQKAILCRKKKAVWCCTKSNLVSAQTSWCCTKKCFLSTIRNLMLHKKLYFIPTKTCWCCTKKCFMLKKYINFFP